MAEALPSGRLEYLDFELQIGRGDGRVHPIAVVRSPAGEAHDTMQFPYDRLALEANLSKLQVALLRSATRARRLSTPEEQGVQEFGAALMNALLAANIRSCYDESLNQARRQGKRLRLRLRIEDPELAALPWEFLYDPRLGEYAALSRSLSVVRYLELPTPVPSLTVTPPLRILAMVAGPKNLPALDIAHEKQRMQAAVAGLMETGLLEVVWLESGSWRELQRAMRGGPWHIFHFIGHGGFDPNVDEGVLALVGEDGKAQPLRASQIGRLLADHPTLRLAVLNACQGAEGSERDLFSSTAASLVQRGIPAVIAMQYEISDDAAIEFSRSLYEALADELPVDAAVAEARIAVNVALNNSLEWGTPVLYMRSADGALFRLTSRGRRPRQRPPTGALPASTEPAAATGPLPPTFDPPPPAESRGAEPGRLASPVPAALVREPPVLAAAAAPAPPAPVAAVPAVNRSSRAPLIAAAVAALLVVGGGTIFALSRGGSKSLPTSRPSAGAGIVQPGVTTTAPAPPAVAAAPVQPATATPPPSTPDPTPVPVMVPPGDYRIVQNTGGDRCLRGRSAAGTTQSIYYCVAEGFVGRVVDGPVSADGYQWYNIDGLGWMAERNPASGDAWLRSVGVPVAPSPDEIRSWTYCAIAIDFQTTISGSVSPPTRLQSKVTFSGPEFAATDGSFSGWLYGQSVYLKYSTVLNGARATGTVIGQANGPGFFGSFVTTAFGNGTGAFGNASGNLQCNGPD